MEVHSGEFQSFLQLSEKLTAFTSFQLQGTGEAESYYSAVKQIVGADLCTELLSTYEEIQKEAADEVSLDKSLRHRILGHPKLGPIARNIIKLWFVGTWYQLPDYWLDKYGMNGEDSTFVVSANAYKEGLLWPTIGSHPMGVKAPGYGTWTAPPEIPVIK